MNLKDPLKFEKIYKEYFSMLVGFAFQYVGDSDTAKDITQEVFSKIWKHSDEIVIRTNVKSYLFGAVRNACLNHVRHEKVKEAHTKEIRPITTEEISFLEMDELADKVQKVMDQLPEKRREVFEMSRFEGKKYKEIAEELGVSIKTVETQMSRALKAMREALGSYLIYLIIGSLIISAMACRGQF